LPERRLRRARIEYRGTIERGDVVELGSTVAQGVDGELAVWLAVAGAVRVSATALVEAADD
jgi:hypothetical protein